jgi:hypothetical protein
MLVPFYLLFLTIIHTVQSYIHSFFPIRRGLSSCILPCFVLKCFLFRGMVWNGIPRVCFYFCSTERNSELFYLPGKGSGQNSRVCFYFCSTERNSELFSLPRKGLERNSERFLFLGTAGIPSEITICSVYSIFHGIFLSEIPYSGGGGLGVYKITTLLPL